MAGKTAMTRFENILSHATEQKASDIHIVSGSFAYIRIHGDLMRLDDEKKWGTWSEEDVRELADEVLEESEMEVLFEVGDTDAGIVVDGVGLRVNVHKQVGGWGMAMRVIPGDIPAPEELNFHESMLRIPEFQDGLVLFTGPTGSGKSTSMAALVDIMNENSARHIITLEDPIEYRFSQKESLIEQRELGRHFKNFPTGLRHVLRQDPDVIMVGEMRDPETIELALTAAETGHLVISTLHTPNAPEAVERIVNVYTGGEQKQILTQLAATLRMVVAQRLLPKKDGGLIGAFEVLTSTQAVKNAIRQNNLSTLESALQTGKKHGMISMERFVQSIADQLPEEVLERYQKSDK